MALGSAEIQFWYRLRELNAIPSSPGILEIGEANWGGDYPLEQLATDIRRLAPDRSEELTRQLSAIAGRPNAAALFWMAKLFYSFVAQPSGITSIDLHGTERAIPHNLNEEAEFDNEVDLVVNNGTAEHVFDIARVFKTIHDACRVGGVMVHVFPCRGWLDHGFWTINPTMVVDLEAINKYERILCAASNINGDIVWSDNAADDPRQLLDSLVSKEDVLLHVAWRKTRPVAFQKPMQGYYAGTRKTWTTFANGQQVARATA